jgi:hypothetical protein
VWQNSDSTGTGTDTDTGTAADNGTDVHNLALAPWDGALAVSVARELTPNLVLQVRYESEGCGDNGAGTTTSNAAFPDVGGGGALCLRHMQSVSLIDNTFTNSSSSSYGGAVLVIDTQDVTVIGNNFLGNSAAFVAGGLGAMWFESTEGVRVTVTSNHFENERGGAMGAWCRGLGVCVYV